MNEVSQQLILLTLVVEDMELLIFFFIFQSDPNLIRELNHQLHEASVQISILALSHSRYQLLFNIDTVLRIAALGDRLLVLLVDVNKCDSNIFSLL